MQSLVSILIPCYNAAPFLAETLDSALAQTWPRIEIIVVDDGSTDDSLTVARRFASHKVQVFYGPNRGAPAARNEALRHAQGDFFQFLDADDLLATDKIARQMATLQAAPKGCVASGAWARFYQQPVEAQFRPEALWADLDPVDWLVLHLGQRLMMHSAAWLVPRDKAERAGTWDEAIWPNPNDDGEYFFRVVLASCGVRFCPEARSFYRSGIDSSLSRVRTEAAWRGLLRTLEVQDQALLAREDSPRIRAALATAFQSFVYEIYPRCPNLAKVALERTRLLGGSDIAPEGGYFFHWLRPRVGWKAARRLQLMAYRFGYARLALGRHMVSPPSTTGKVPVEVTTPVSSRERQ